MTSTNRLIHSLVLLLAVGMLVALLVPAATQSTRAAVREAVPAPVVTGFNGVTEGQAISGKVAIEALVTGNKIARVVFRLDGARSTTHTEKRRPYFFLGDNHTTPNGWDTTHYPDGAYTLTATATNAAGRTSVRAIHFTIANRGKPAPTQPPTPQATTTPTAPPTATPPSTGGQILWSADHETGDFSQWNGPAGWDGGFQNTGTGFGEISADVAHSGRYSAKLTITDADGLHDNQAVRLFRVKESRAYPEAYYSVWYYFPQRYTPAAWWNVFQFKSRNASRNDAFWQLNVGNRYNTGNMHFYLTSWATGGAYNQQIKDIPVGQWTHLEVYYKQSAATTGRITVWQDGAMLFDVQGITTSFADATETANWSINSYTDNISPSTAAFYIDDAVISTKRIGL